MAQEMIADELASLFKETEKEKQRLDTFELRRGIPSRDREEQG